MSGRKQNLYKDAEARFHGSFRKKWKTDRRWWLKCAAVSIGLARLYREMGESHEVHMQLNEARWCREYAMSLPRMQRNLAPKKKRLTA
ncbi:hypothetical protein [Gluconobacter cerinus]|uniref:Uncharacterized protein n=1 Tax=Gluconobacter cerinus TaxID=38307 RepID=A0A1B6VKI9_9PROT|nr:hypothetical protein [Gluconobacter cerinus]OAJ67733.1 hypothetical protein A0123_01775 [Gluconobacter cerinus]